MLKIDFTQEDVDNLHYERYHHPHPERAEKDGSSVPKKPGCNA